jgi:FkbM family methyltransferase
VAPLKTDRQRGDPIVWAKRTAKLFVSKMPMSRTLYRLCHAYVDHYKGENNYDAEANGELRLLHDRLSSCRTVFDVGANVGDWASLALSVNPQIALHCFEPSPVTFSRLSLRSFPANVTLNNCGLGASDSEAELFVFADGSGNNSLYQRHGLAAQGIGSPTNRETVKIERLDAYCAAKAIGEVDFLKLDVEGHELEVLKGARDMLKGERIKLIQFEYGGCDIDARVLLRDIWAIFDGLDYTFFKLYPNGRKRVGTYAQSLEGFEYQNWAVIRNDTL